MEWQRTPEVSVIYMLYRCMVAASFIGILIASVVEPDTDPPDSLVIYYAKWPIYLTHWALTICTIQAIMGALLVVGAYKRNTGAENTVYLKPSYKIYRIIHSIAVVVAFGVTSIYWFAVYNPAEDKIDTMNILIHVMNSVFMITDVLIIAFPFKLVYCIWPLLFGLSFVIFSFVYYISGGTSRKDNVYLYKILDWSKPTVALIVSALAIGFMLFLYFAVWTLCVLRRKLAESICNIQFASAYDVESARQANVKTA